MRALVLTASLLLAAARPAAAAVDQPIGAACADTAECVAGATCVDLVCCESDCLVADPTRCTACSVATGATADGTCTNVAGRICREARGPCDEEEACTGTRPDCPYDEEVEDVTPCPGGLCWESECIPVPWADAGPDAGPSGGGGGGCDAGGGGGLGLALALLGGALAQRRRAVRA